MTIKGMTNKERSEMTTRESPELIALAEKISAAARTNTRLTMFSEEDVLDMAAAVEFTETAVMIGTVTPEKAARLAVIQSTGARMAADKQRHDAEADARLSEALGGAQWLLAIADGEDD
jgi:hypothetical protein